MVDLPSVTVAQHYNNACHVLFGGLVFCLLTPVDSRIGHIARSSESALQKDQSPPDYYCSQAISQSPKTNYIIHYNHVCTTVGTTT